MRECRNKTLPSHGLRHPHCTLLFEAVASIMEVQVRLYSGFKKSKKAVIRKFKSCLSILQFDYIYMK